MSGLPNGSTKPVIVRAGSCEKQGRRNSMEDAVSCYAVHEMEQLRKAKAKESESNEEPDHDLAFFAVFDGHGGQECASFSAKTIPSLLSNHPTRYSDVGKSLNESFLKCDDLLRDHLQCNFSDSKEYNSGCTATGICLQIDRKSGSCNKIICANSGDSRCVLVQRDGTAIPLSEDHGVAHPGERKRIYDAGGFISSPQYGASKERVLGALAVTRALGDFDFKLPRVTAWGTLAAPITADLVDATPDVTEHQVDKKMDLAVIIACDGIWDVFSSQAASQRVAAWLKKAARTLREKSIEERCTWVASKLIDAALELGSSDNCSCIIVALAPLSTGSSACSIS